MFPFYSLYSVVSLYTISLEYVCVPVYKESCYFFLLFRGFLACLPHEKTLQASITIKALGGSGLEIKGGSSSLNKFQFKKG